MYKRQVLPDVQWNGGSGVSATLKRPLAKLTMQNKEDVYKRQGLSYGYMLPFARHWAAEFTIGAGYVRTKYDVYYNIPTAPASRREYLTTIGA